jgi:hypothetical protein
MHTSPGGECPRCLSARINLQRMPESVTSQGGGPSPDAQPGSTVGSHASVTGVLSGQSSVLDAGVRMDMEQRFGFDFSRVRVHNDALAGRSAHSLGAQAYTVGSRLVFAQGRYAPESSQGRRLLAHELAHVVQQEGADPRSVSRLQIMAPQDPSEAEADSVADRVLAKDALRSGPVVSKHRQGLRLQRKLGESAGNGDAGGSSATAPAPTPARPNRLDIDVLAAEDPDDFLVRAAARDLGTDIRVRSMTDMVDQVSALAGSGSCVTSLEIFNHGNPQMQTVSGGNKVKSAAGEVSRRPTSGFERSWLFNSGNRDALQRLRGSFCCNGETRWFGCSTAGVSAEGGRRTEAERRTSEHRYTDYPAEFYQSVDDAAAHGAAQFRSIGSVNVQSWANALCTPITAATDFNNWSVRGSGYTRTVIYGGREVRFTPQADIGCACDAASGRIGGALQSSAQMRQRATELREAALRPTYERARSAIGREQTHTAETTEQRETRERFEAAQQEHFNELGRTIRESVLRRAGFSRGSGPTTPEEALRVVSLWGLNINRIVSAMPALTASTSGAVRGHTSSVDLSQQQRSLEAALSPQGRETFMAAMLELRQERFWDEHLRHTTIYIFPDLSGVNRYRGFTQSGNYTNDAGQTHQAFIVHISRDMLNGGQVDLVVANLVHELTHTLHEPNVLDRATRAFNQDLAELLADHPQIQALRSAATGPGSAREAHVSRIRQMLFEATGYVEGEIFAHLQQLTHQPDMTIDGSPVSASHFILEHVILYIARLRQIGMPPRMLAGMLASIHRRIMQLYDRRIAATTIGSRERQVMQANKNLAHSIFQLAVTLSEENAP